MSKCIIKFFQTISKIKAINEIMKVTLGNGRRDFFFLVRMGWEEEEKSTQIVEEI